MTTATATGPAAAFHTAIAAAGLPADLFWTVQVSPRRKHFAATVEPGGAVVFKVPAGADPAKVAKSARNIAGRVAVAAADSRDHGARIVRKELVDGEGFSFAGTHYRLTLVDDSDTGKLCHCQCGRLRVTQPGVPIYGERYHGWWLTLRRDAANTRTVVEWYRAQGQAWLDEHAPRMLARAHVPADKFPTWEVRPWRAGQKVGGSWGSYDPATHTMRFDWMIFQFPPELLRHILAHEVAHAALCGQCRSAHGPEWQLVMGRLCPPDWREIERRAKSAERLSLWAGEVGRVAREDGPTAEPTAAELAAEMRRVVRRFSKHTSEQRADLASSHRAGPQQRKAVGTYFYTHPDDPGHAHDTRQKAARAGWRARLAAEWRAAHGAPTTPEPAPVPVVVSAWTAATLPVPATTR